MICKMVLKSLRHEKVRCATAVLGVAAATGLVVWSLGLALTSAAQSRVAVRRMTEPFDCWVSTGGVGARFDGRAGGAMNRPRRGDSIAPALAPATVDAVRAVPGVERVYACKVINTTLDYRPGGRILQGPPLRGAMTLAQKAGCPYANATVTGEWPDPDSTEIEAAVCSAVFTPRRLEPPPPGTALVLMTPSGTVKVRITAVVVFPQTVTGFPTIFASAGAMRQAAGGAFDPSPNLLLCGLRGDAVTGAVLEAVAAAEPSAAFAVMSRREIESQFSSDKLNNFKRQAPLLLTLSVLTALCMLVNALTVGVDQKLRVLALLRAAGMTNRQVVHVIMLEGLALSAGGWGLGTLGGWALLALFVRRMPEAFPEGVAMGWVTPAATAAGVALIAALSLLWPCRRALRIRPLDALDEHGGDPDAPGRAHPRRVWIGLVMLFPMLLLALPLPVSAMTRSVLLLTAGIPLHFAGLLLFLPGLVRAVERAALPTAAAVLRLDVRLLRHRISRHTARTAGAVLTLAVGLGSFAAIHIWGGSMMRPFIPSRTFPDLIVSILPNGLATDETRKVAGLEGVADGRCLPIEAAQLMIADELTERIRQRSGKAPAFPNVLIFGAEPHAAYDGDTPLARFRFVAGERRTAAAEMERGGACVITKMFARETGLGVGHDLTVKRRGRGGRGPAAGVTAGVEENMRIVGVVDLNWHLVTSRAQLRGRGDMPQGTMGPVFVSEAEARRFSGNSDKTSFLWLNLSEAYRAKGALPAGRLLERDIRSALKVGNENTVRAHHRDEIEDGAIAHGTQLIGDMARAPFWSLVVLSTGIITLLIASCQSSAKTFAVMRAVGMTRGQLGRLLLGEAVLTGICGIALSLLSGFCIGWTFTGWTRAWMPFGGLPLSLSVPWLLILQGAFFTFALCVAMAVPPIVWMVRKQDAGLT